MSQVAVVYIPHQFGKPQEFKVPAGTRFREIVESCLILDARQRPANLTVYANENQILPNAWTAKPKAKDREGNPISVIVIGLAAGGQGGSRKILANAVLLAAVAAGAIISGGTLLPAIGPLTAAQVSALGAGLVVAAGSIAARFIAPPPTLGAQKEQEDPGIAGIGGNPLQLEEHLPTVFGFMRVSPPIISSPGLISENDNQRALVCYGVQGRFDRDAPLINGASLDDMVTNGTATVQYQEGVTSDGAMSHEAAKTYVIQPGAEMQNFILDPDGGSTMVPTRNNLATDIPAWQQFTTGGPTTAWWIDLVWPGGIVKTNDGEIAAVGVRVEFRVKGQTTWRKGPVFHFKDDKPAGAMMRQFIRFEIAADPGGSLVAADADFNCFLAMRRTGAVYTSDAYFTDKGSDVSNHVNITEDGATVYLNPASGFSSSVAYEVRIKRSLAFQYDKFTHGSNIYQWNGDSTLAIFFDAIIDGGIRKATIGQTKYSSTMAIERFQTIDKNSNAFTLTGLQVWKAALSIINKQVQSFSIVLKSKFRTWNGSAWSAANSVTATQNPAAIALAILLGTNGINAKPVPTSKIDMNAFGAWYTHCVNKGLKCNMVWEGGRPIMEALAVVAACGGARIVRKPEWSPIIESDRRAETPVQTITGLNSRGFSFTKDLNDLPEAIRFEYLDETDDFNAKTVLIAAPGFTTGTATRVDGMKLEGVTTLAQATYLGNLYLRQLYWRPATYSVQMPLEGLWARPGDIVAVNTDVLFSGHKPSRIKSFTKSGSNVTKIQLEDPLNVAQIIDEENALDDIAIPDPVSAAGVVIKLLNKTTIRGQVVQGANDNELQFVTPFLDPGPSSLAAGCHVGAGGWNKEYRRMVLTQIEWTDSPTIVTLTLVDQAVLIHGQGGNFNSIPSNPTESQIYGLAA